LHHLLHSQSLTGGENGGYHSPPNERHLSRGDVPGQHNPAVSRLKSKLIAWQPN
jgi:hypothetical protein